jgi:hypothetical protein
MGFFYLMKLKMKLPFGKFKNQYVEDVDPNYLMWLLDNSDNLEFYLKRAIIQHLNNISIDLNDKSQIRKIYIQLSKKYHPDNGGNNEAMKAINDFYNELLKFNK